MAQKSPSITIREVAEQAGVSVATVSRHINKTAAVSPETAARINDVVNALNYVPSAAARNLATSKTKSIGLLLADNSYSDYFTPILRGIEEVVTGQYKYNLLIASRRREDQDKEVPPLGHHNTDGLLVFVNSLSDVEIEALANINFPMVLMHDLSPAHLNIPSIMVQNREPFQEIVEHLITVHNRKRILFVSGPAGWQDAIEREEGYRAALAAHDIPYQSELVINGEFRREIAYLAMLEFLVSGIEFDGVAASNDESASGVLEALRKSGKRIPEDVSLVGFDDKSFIAEYMTPKLTTVHAPTLEVGRAAGRQLVKLVNGEQVGLETLLPTEAVIRQSCGCP
jgi:LacI family transcriptional regulator